MMSWYERSKEHIARLTADLPADATDKQRAKVLTDGYPYAMRMGAAYKGWLRARKEHLAKHSHQPAGPLDARPHLSPLERQKLRGEAGMLLSEAELRRRGA